MKNDLVVSVGKFHKTRLGYLVFGLVELALSYVVALWAIGNGSLWLWGLAFILLFGFLQNLFRMIFSR